MNTKLTLSLNEATIEKAKKYAFENNKSVSKIVEEYFEEITFNSNSGVSPRSGKSAVSKEIVKLKGIIKIEDWEKNARYDHRLDYLLEKYK